MQADITGNTIEGEYKDYEITIDENDRVIVGEKIKGEKPTGRIIIQPIEENATEVIVQVIGEVQGDATIISIENLDEKNIVAIEDESNSETSQMFKVTDNGYYTFKIKASNGRSTKIKMTEPITGLIIARDDLINAVSLINTSGINKVKVKGKTSQEEQENQEIYSLDVIKYEGNMVLDGIKTYEGAILDEENKIYQFGDVNLATNNTVVLKIEGDLIINENVTLTSVDAPKGLFVYCTGKLINEGTITMTGKGGNTSAGQNVYLYKKKDGSFEFVPATGGTGGAFSGSLVAYDGKQSDLNRGLAGGGGSTDGYDGGHNGANATSWTSGAGGSMCGRTEQEQKHQDYL